jgi:hypothetical protein
MGQRLLGWTCVLVVAAARLVLIRSLDIGPAA